ncbi:MAG: 30S ribosomal protein S16 [Candidatus Peregrinibacteria bacterium]
MLVFLRDFSLASTEWLPYYADTLLAIRLQITGKRNDRAFRIVLAEKQEAVKGKFQEIFGHFLPSRTPPVFECKVENIQAWIKKGAKPSNTVARLLRNQGVKGMEPYITTYTKKKSKNEEAAKPAEAAAATPAPVEAKAEKKAE